ncbi:MAG TPA: radical SAM protein [Candidatus Angelobacter sp.]|nr:radical SAM protein [Candidatus Angelobacter sp.]
MVVADSNPFIGHLVDECETQESLFYVTVLSNLVRGYDKYARIYDKRNIEESTFSNRFFLLKKHEIGIGVAKASRLLNKTGLPNDRLIALETHASADELHPNLSTGLGRYVERSWIAIEGVYLFSRFGRLPLPEGSVDLDDSMALVRLQMEEACALSLQLHLPDKNDNGYERLSPRSVSILPIAMACQARCPFCFSKASVSADMQHGPMGERSTITAGQWTITEWRRVTEVLQQARVRGASRAVITGGGEPSLLRDADLDRLIREAAACFPKVVLISNGYKWGSLPEAGDTVEAAEAKTRAEAIRRLDVAGLSVLAISRHHFDSKQNTALMHLETRSEEVARTWITMRSSLKQLRLRWICVLQRGGIDNRESLEQYLDWAVESGVEEICFKELYVSASVESEYYDHEANEWSCRNQVPLRLVLDLAHDSGWETIETLPWGAPIFDGCWRGHRVRVAAYTEPSLFWELKNGICRSWNLMADGRCLTSLEDRKSEVLNR